MRTEIWRTPIVNGEPYENYQVSNFGKILSLNYRNTGKPELKKPSEDKYGYLRVGLCKDGKRKTCKVHRIVAETFLPNPEKKPCVNHKIEGEEGKTMNFVFFNEDGTVDEEKTTIEWNTSEENNNYGTRNERAAKTRTNGKLSKRVLQLSLSGDFIREWESTMECGRNGFNQGNVAACCRGKRKTHKGFIFKYK
jgi:hypothetical protein